MKDILLRHVDVGGKEVRLEETTDFYNVYEGKRTIYRIPKNFIKRETLWQLVTDYVNYLKQLQNEFLDDELPVDKIADKADKLLRDEITKRLRQFFDEIPKEKTNKEAFLGDGIFGRLKKVFQGLNAKINDIVSQTLKDLNVQIIDDVDDTGVETDSDTKKYLTDKNKLMQQTVSDQVIKTKDDILADIKRDLSDGITAGKSMTKIKQDIEAKYNYRNGIGWKADRSIKTSISNANTRLKLLKWLNMGFTKFEWITRNDEKVREKHRQFNHKVFDIKKALDDTDNWDAYPGKSANCRCTAIPYS